MNDNVIEKIKKDDKKAFKSFAIIIIVSAIIGGIFGALSADIDNNLMNGISSRIINFISIITPFASIILTIFVTIIAEILYKKSRNKYEIWNKTCEDEEEIDRIEEKLSYILFLAGTNMVLAFFFFGVGMVLLPMNGPQENLNIGKMICLLIGFILCLVSTTLLQKKVINFEKEINPFLKGSVYDAKFSKKWIDSCDEALKLGIYKSAYKAYKSVNFTCILLWLFCIIGSTFWDFGIAPIAIVTIIWLVQSTTYYIESIRVSKSKNKNK